MKTGFVTRQIGAWMDKGNLEKFDSSYQTTCDALLGTSVTLSLQITRDEFYAIVGAQNHDKQVIVDNDNRKLGWVSILTLVALGQGT